MLKYLNITLIFLIIVFLLPANPVFAYKRDTHEYLTKEAADLFNSYYSSFKISEDLINQIVAGARDEDDLNRPLYHFYDPVNDRGLKIGFSEWLSAKDWSVDSDAQLALKPLFSLANIFRTNQEMDFTWNRAVEYYKNSDKEKAFYVLGHIMHLIQDMAVPDHTRNDQHLGGSPYEKFSYKKEAGFAGEQPVVLSSLDEYFNQLSKYSNNNFYSEDTIGLYDYKLPQPDYQVYKDGFYYGLKVDSSGEYYLSRKSGRSLLFANVFNITVDDPLVLDGYWNRLSQKAVQYSAGLIKFFISQVEETEQNLSEGASLQKIEKSSSVNSEFAEENKKQIGEVVKKTNVLLGEIETVIKNIGKGTIVVVPSYVKPKTVTVQENLASLSQISQVLTDQNVLISERKEEDTSVELPNSPISPNLVISEFLFDAEGTDTGKEFIRLCNLGPENVSLEGWSIQTSSKKKNFETGNQIAGNGSFLIWFGENQDADMEWKSGSLKNATDTIYIVNKTEIITGDSDLSIIDKTFYDVSKISGFEPGQVITSNSCGVGGVSVSDTVDVVNETENWNIAEINFYKDPAIENGSIIDIYFDSYPLINGRTDAWKALVFYKDSEPQSDNEFLETAGDWLPNHADNLLNISYPNYSGEINRRSLILPDVIGRYGNQGGLQNVAFKYEILYEDKIIRLKTKDSADYLTVSAYDFYQSGGGNQSFKLEISGKTKFFWQENLPPYLPPIISGEPAIIFDKEKSQVVISWTKAADPDSLDSLITYNLNVNGYKQNISVTEYRTVINPGDVISFSVRAIDEFGNSSEEKLLNWNYPQTEIFLGQNQWAGWSSPFGSKNPNCPSCESSASEFEIKPDKDFSSNFISVRILHEKNPGWPANLRLRVYSEAGDLIVSKIMPGVIGPDSEKDLTFIFNENVVLKTGEKYELILDVESYSDHRAFFESAFKNAVSESGDWYYKIGKIIF